MRREPRITGSVSTSRLSRQSEMRNGRIPVPDERSCKIDGDGWGNRQLLGNVLYDGKPTICNASQN